MCYPSLRIVVLAYRAIPLENRVGVLHLALTQTNQKTPNKANADNSQRCNLAIYRNFHTFLI
jgi:hypothetical protein